MGWTCHTPWEAQAFLPYVDSASASTLGILATPVAGTRDGNQEYSAVFCSSVTGGYLAHLMSRFEADTAKIPSDISQLAFKEVWHKDLVSARGSQYVRILESLWKESEYIIDDKNCFLCRSWPRNICEASENGS